MADQRFLLLLTSPNWLLFWRIVLGLSFFVAGIAKVRDRAGLRNIIISYHLLPDAGAYFLASVLPWIEIGVALSLWSGVLLTTGLAGATMLLIVFSIAIAVNLLRGRKDISCGCFGKPSQLISWKLVGRNLTLGAISTIVLLGYQWQSWRLELPSSQDIIPVIILACAATMVSFLLPNIQHLFIRDEEMKSQ